MDVAAACVVPAAPFAVSVEVVGDGWAYLLRTAGWNGSEAVDADGGSLGCLPRLLRDCTASTAVTVTGISLRLGRLRDSSVQPFPKPSGLVAYNVDQNRRAPEGERA